MSERAVTRRRFLKSAGAVGTAAIVGGATGAIAFGDPPKRKNRAKRHTLVETQPAPKIDDLLESTEALFRPTASGCTVHWIPKRECEARVLAGRSPTELQVVATRRAAEPSSLDVRGFPPDSDMYLQCQYRGLGDGAWIEQPIRRARTQRSASAAFRVALIADTHADNVVDDPDRLCATRATIAAVIEDKPDFVVFLGDEYSQILSVLQGTPTSPEIVAQRWRAWRGLYADLLANAPSFFVLGNHEGEAGYQQRLKSHGKTYSLQRWATVARKQTFLNPLPSTYAEGGEDEGWIGDQSAPETGGADEGNCSPLQNYYAWTWGDALFVVLDVQRYTNPGGKRPDRVQEWTVGKAQMRWFEGVLAASRARWKFVIAHHVVGGWKWNADGSRDHGACCYGRGGAHYAKVGEQARITQLMRKYSAQFFLYGHDHVFSHQDGEGIDFVCCGRPSFLVNPNWLTSAGWREAYAPFDSAPGYYAAVGYTRLTVSPVNVELEYIRTAEDSSRKENVHTPVGGAVYCREFC